MQKYKKNKIPKKNQKLSQINLFSYQSSLVYFLQCTVNQKVSAKGSEYYKLTEKIEKIEEIIQNLSQNHKETFVPQKDQIVKYWQYGDRLKIILDNQLTQDPNNLRQQTQSKAEIELDHTKFGDVDKFSIMPMVVLQKIRIDKGVKNIFDFSCVENRNVIPHKIEIQTDENSKLEKNENEEILQINYLATANKNVIK